MLKLQTLLSFYRHKKLPGIKNALGHAAGLEHGEYEQHGIADARPHSFDHIGIHSDIAYQNGIDRHTYDDQEGLKAQGKQSPQVILPHMAPFAVCHGRQRDRSHRRDQVNLNHPAKDHDKDTDGQYPGDQADQHALEP